MNWLSAKNKLEVARKQMKLNLGEFFENIFIHFCQF